MIDKELELKLIEIKSAQTIKHDFLKNLIKIEKLAINFKVQKKIIYAGTERREQYETKILTWENIDKIE